MEELFASLSRRQSMMLLTAVTFGGQEALPVLAHLPDEEAAVLRHRAERMLEIPRERRIPLLVQEIKRLVTARKGHLWSAEPEALARLLQQERPALRELILRALPVALADAVRLYLPATAVQVREELPPGVLGIVRWKLEGLLQQASAGTLWKFSDLLMLKPRELYTLADRQGCRALATAIAALLGEEQAAFFQALPPELASLSQRAVAAAAGRELPQADARALLAQHGAESSPLEAIRSAGIQRLARACLAQGADFAPRLVERHRPPFAPVFQRWMNDERTRAAAKGDGGRAEIVADLERLEARGLVEKPARLPAMSRKPVVPPPAAQARARPPVPSPAPPVPSSGSLPIHERGGERSSTPPVPPPAASWDAPPGALDPRVASRAMRARPAGGTAPVFAPVPQRAAGSVPPAAEPRPPPVMGEGAPGAGLSSRVPSHERGSEPHGAGQGLQGRSMPRQGADGGSPSPAARQERERTHPAPRSRAGGLQGTAGHPQAGEPSAGLPAHERGAAEERGGASSAQPRHGALARRPVADAADEGSPVPGAGASHPAVGARRPGIGVGESRAAGQPGAGPAGRERLTRRPGAGAGESRSAGRAGVGESHAEREAVARRAGASGAASRTSGRPSPEGARRDATDGPATGVVPRPAWPSAGNPRDGLEEDEKTAAIRPPRGSTESAAARTADEPGAARAASPNAPRPGARGEATAPVIGRRPSRDGGLRPEAPSPPMPDGDDDEATHAFRPPRRKSDPVPASPAARTAPPHAHPGGDEVPSPGATAPVSSSADDERTVSLRRASHGTEAPGSHGADDEAHEKTVAFRAPRPPAGRKAAPGRDRNNVPGMAAGEGARAADPGDDADEVTAFFQRPAAGREPKPAVPPSSVRAPVPPAVPRQVGETGSNEITASSLSAIRRGGAAASGAGPALPPSSSPERPGRVPPRGPDAAYARTAAHAPITGGRPAVAGDAAIHGAREVEQPERTEAFSAPVAPRAGAGRVQGTAHLRGDGPSRGPVVTRPPQRRRSDSRIRKAVEAPIAPAPPAPPVGGDVPRSPRVVRSSARHKAVKGPGRGPGGGTG